MERGPDGGSVEKGDARFKELSATLWGCKNAQISKAVRVTKMARQVKKERRKQILCSPELEGSSNPEEREQDSR